MAELGSVAWPPAPIRTERLVLRQSEPRDRTIVIELHASPDVYAYLGGPPPRDHLEEVVPQTPGQHPGFFAVELEGAMVGLVSFSRRDADRRGHLGPEANEVELSYLFLPSAWGHGYATESCAAALDWADQALPCEAVVLCTQTANERSVRLAAKLGFHERERFEEFSAEQWFGVRPAVTPAN